MDSRASDGRTGPDTDGADTDDERAEQPSADGLELPMGPQSTPLTVEYLIGSRRYALWRYGNEGLQAPADVWALRDDGLRLTINTARARVRIGAGERAVGDNAGGWGAGRDRAALVAAARAFQATYDKVERKRKRRAARRPGGRTRSDVPR